MNNRFILVGNLTDFRPDVEFLDTGNINEIVSEFLQSTETLMKNSNSHFDTIQLSILALFLEEASFHLTSLDFMLNNLNSTCTHTNTIPIFRIKLYRKPSRELNKELVTVII